jgi:hypothetical protein
MTKRASASMTSNPATIRHYLKTRNTGIREELRDAFTDSFAIFADRIERFAAEQPDLVNEMAHWHAVDEVPSRLRGKDGKIIELASLPGDLNEPFNAPGQGCPPLPRTEGDLEPFMRVYWPYRVQRSSTLSPGLQANASQHRQDLKEELRRRILAGETMEPAAWQEYEAVHRAQQERARRGAGVCLLNENAALLDSIDNLEFSNARGILELATRRYERFLMAPTSGR